MADINCTRCGQTKPALERAPFPGAVGARIVSQICQDCWGLWLKQQTMLINHYGLN
ncbi:MAG: Fe(2+)-trafficking protein, partial [Gemmatimonadaceae bacterium]